MRRKWRRYVYESALYCGLVATIGATLVATVRLFFMGQLSAEVLEFQFLTQLAKIAAAATTFHVTFYLWWMWQLSKLTRDLGSTTRHEIALENLIALGKRGVAPLIRALTAPNFQWRRSGGKVGWDVDIVRRLAAEGLGKLKDPDAVEPLIETLDDPEVGLRSKAVEALAAIGDPRAAPALIPLLGEETTVVNTRMGTSDRAFDEAMTRTLQGVDGSKLSDLAADAMERLGEKKIASAFRRMLSGDDDALDHLRGTDRAKIIAGLARALDSENLKVALRAVWALGELHAVEALPQLRAKTGVFSGADSKLKEQCEKIIDQLANLSGLPRPAEHETSVETLPRATVPTLEPDPATLPRATSE